MDFLFVFREYSLEARSSRKKETTPVEKNRNKEKKQNVKVDVNIPSIGIGQLKQVLILHIVR